MAGISDISSCDVGGLIVANEKSRGQQVWPGLYVPPCGRRPGGVVPCVLVYSVCLREDRAPAQGASVERPADDSDGYE